MKRTKAIKLTDEAFQDIEKQKWKEAEKKLDKVLKHYQDIPDAHSEKALIEYHFGNEEKGKHHLNLAYKHASEDPKFLSNLSAYYYRNKDYRSAETLIKDGIKRYPDYPGFYLANVHIMQALGLEPKEIYHARENGIQIYRERGKRSDGLPLSEDELTNYFTLKDDEEYDGKGSLLIKTDHAFIFKESNGNYSFVLPKFKNWKGKSPWFKQAKLVLSKQNSKTEVVVSRQRQDHGGYRPTNARDLLELAYMYVDHINCKCIYANECSYFPKLLSGKELPAISFAYYHTNLNYYAKKIVFFSQTIDEWTFTIKNYTRGELIEFHQMIKEIKPFSYYKGKNDAFQRAKVIG